MAPPNVNVLAPAVAAVAMLIVLALVPVLANVNTLAAPAKLTVVAVVLNTLAIVNDVTKSKALLSTEPSISIRFIVRACLSAIPLGVPVIKRMLPLVAKPVAKPPCNNKLAPAISDPTPFSALITALTGVELASLEPIVTFLLRIKNVDSFTIVPTRARLDCVVFVKILKVNVTPIDPAEVTGQVPFNAVTPEPSIVI